MKSKEIHLLSQKAVDGIAEGTTAVVRNTIDCVRDGMKSCLDSAGIAFEAIPGLAEVFDADNTISNPFSHVATKHKQTAFYRGNFGLVVSIVDLVTPFLPVHINTVPPPLLPSSPPPPCPTCPPHTIQPHLPALQPQPLAPPPCGHITLLLFQKHVQFTSPLHRQIG